MGWDGVGWDGMGRTDGWMDGFDGWMDGWTDRSKHSNIDADR